MRIWRATPCTNSAARIAESIAADILASAAGSGLLACPVEYGESTVRHGSLLLKQALLLFLDVPGFSFHDPAYERSDLVDDFIGALWFLVVG